MPSKKRPVVEVEFSIAGEDVKSLQGDAVLMVVLEGDGTSVALGGSFPDGQQDMMAMLSSAMKAVLSTCSPNEYLPILLTSVAGALISQAKESGMPEDKMEEIKELLQNQMKEMARQHQENVQ